MICLLMYTLRLRTLWSFLSILSVKNTDIQNETNPTEARIYCSAVLYK